jgi:hypothetical protein
MAAQTDSCLVSLDDGADGVGAVSTSEEGDPFERAIPIQCYSTSITNALLYIYGSLCRRSGKWGGPNGA